MKVVLKPLLWIYCIYALILFVGIMLLIFPFVIISSFFGRIRGGNMIMRLCMFWADLWFPLIFIWNSRIYETPHDKSKTYIFIVNHDSFLDAAIIPKAFRQPVRPLAKVELVKVPVFGFIYKMVTVTVARSSASDRANSIRLLKSITGKGVSVLVFPEGTFNTTGEPLKDFYDGAFRVAIDTQTPLKPVLFVDAHARMQEHYLFTLNPGRCRIVYLEEIPVAGMTVKDIPALKQKAFDIMDKKLREYKASWIKL